MAQASITDYRTYFAAGSIDGQDVAILRTFLKEGNTYYLAANVSSLQTYVIEVSRLTLKQESWDAVIQLFKTTPYINAINRAKSQSFALQDAGIIHGYPKEKGITLTIDLCPSHKPLDRVIFTSLITEFKKTEIPVPVALSVSGRFLLTHGEDIEWLKNLEKAGEITITWINHTYNHHFDPNAPLTENFLLEPGTDVDFEILGTELAMLQKGLIPSVFFRFPGLVSDNSVVEKVMAYGLIPIGSDAWLAKGQNAGSGSIVLIHGNGNEPVGVKDFIKLLHDNAEAVHEHQWLLYDLRESVKNEFSDK